MLIGSGWAKGLKLKAPKGEATRPTSSRVRGAILNMLAPELEDALFLDLFAGSGAMGIEAVSRGARGAVFVEQGKDALGCLKVNLQELERRAKAQSLSVAALVVLGRDVAKAFGELASHGPFDVVFVDPPYREARAWTDQVLSPLRQVTSAGALLVIETASADGDYLAGVAVAAGWEIVKQREYGDTMVSMLRRAENDEADDHGA